jgi:hypothetical protein
VRQLTVLALALLLASLVAGILARTPAAQAEGDVYDACRKQEATIVASDLAGFPVDNAAQRPSCEGRYDVEGVMTHERGHTFGLDHVSEDEHGRLTMSTAMNGPCQDSERTLDLNAKYR